MPRSRSRSTDQSRRLYKELTRRLQESADNRNKQRSRDRERKVRHEAGASPEETQRRRVLERQRKKIERMIKETSVNASDESGETPLFNFARLKFFSSLHLFIA